MQCWTCAFSPTSSTICPSLDAKSLGHSLKRGALTTGMQQGVHPAQLKRLGRHKSFDVLGEYLKFGDLFAGHPLGGVLYTKSLKV